MLVVCRPHVPTKPHDFSVSLSFYNHSYNSVLEQFGEKGVIRRKMYFINKALLIL